MGDLEWQDDAACRADPEVMFPRHERIWTDIENAKALCGECPVIGECLPYAVHLARTTILKYGIWAGLSAAELNKLARAGWTPPPLRKPKRKGDLPA